ncbi:unnamed protein product [Camellia sinensis]
MKGTNSKPFSKGVKFKSKHTTLLVLDFFTTGSCCCDCDEDKDSSVEWLSLKAVVAAAALCRLMWPPKACPMANSRPHIEHSWVLGLGGELWVIIFMSPPPINLGFLWLALWPPRAWNDGNWRLQVLHSKTRLGEVVVESEMLPVLRERSMRQLAMVVMLSSSPSLPLFMPKYTIE